MRVQELMFWGKRRRSAAYEAEIQRLSAECEKFEGCYVSVCRYASAKGARSAPARAVLGHIDWLRRRLADL